ncbi:DUF1120 domain-containing protein [Pseudomonas resinovorans]|uniref:DUF1120 domain-containing protein n=1 Tax=Metapseudomonas resinovorans TaxID=53412 RepID=A0ABT4YC79_METRE|nr:DUF1120 domain-containing protein [Pseudomonas resinovorans]MDA8486503.1 DUF1120 domain-containing protein [Pseudomonas resinovorans]
MKQLVLLPLALAFTANAAMAANSADLRVTGTITPASCSIAMSGNTFDLGTLDAGKLTEPNRNPLPRTAPGTLTIQCDAPTQVAFKTHDNRRASIPTTLASTVFYYGLGFDAKNAPIGCYALVVLTPSIRVDGQEGNIKWSTTEGANWGINSINGLDNLSPYSEINEIYSLDAASNPNHLPPTPATSMSMDIAVDAYIEAVDTLDTTQEIAIDGSTTIELIYL